MQNGLSCPFPGQWIECLSSIHTQRSIILAIKKNTSISSAIRWMEPRHIEWNRPFSERCIMHISFYVWNLIKKKQRKSKDYEEVEDEQCQKTRTIYAVLYVDCSV